MAVEQNLIQVQSRLQDPAVRNEDLIKYANGSNPEVPSFLALIEMNRRKQIESSANQFNKSSQDSIKNQVASALTQPQAGGNMGANPFNTNIAAEAPGVNMAGNPAKADITQGIAGINPAAMPAQPVTAPIKPITGAEGGLMSLPIDHFNEQSYAGGGIVAFGDPNLNPNETQLVADKTVGGMTVDKAVAIARERNAQSNIPFTSEDESVIRRRFAGAEGDPSQKTSTATTSKAPTAPVKSEPTGIAGFQAIMDSLPKMTAPVQKTQEELFAAQKERDRLAGVSADPYADSKRRMSAMEERQNKANEDAGYNRLIGQLASFASADPAKGFGYAGAVSAQASQAIEEKQNALREKQETAQIEFVRAMEKEDDARKRKDSDGIKAALDQQQKAQFDFQKAQTDLGTLAANIFNVTEDSRNQREANASTAAYHRGMLDYYKRTADIAEATKPNADDVLFNRIIAKAENDKTIQMLAKKQEAFDVGTPEYNAIEMEKYRRLALYFDKRPDLMPPKPTFPAPKEPPKKDDLAWWQVRSRMERDKKQKNTIPNEWSVTPIQVD